MMNSKRFPRYPLVASALFAALFLSSLQAAVITDPTLVTTGNKIAPYSTGVTHVASGATAEATLEGRSDLSVLEGFGSFAATSNIVSFTNAALPDISIAGNTGSPISGNNTYASSNGSSLRIQPTVAGTKTLTIDFGIYDGSTFDGSSTGVTAAGFTLNTPAATLDVTTSITATFFDVNNQALSTQSISGPSVGTANYRIYFGYQSSGNAISSIKIDILSTAGVLYGFDDLAFTPAISTIPEPATAALLLGIGALGAVVTRRRRSV